MKNIIHEIAVWIFGFSIVFAFPFHSMVFAFHEQPKVEVFSFQDGDFDAKRKCTWGLPGHIQNHNVAGYCGEDYVLYEFQQTDPAKDADYICKVKNIDLTPNLKKCTKVKMS